MTALIAIYIPVAFILQSICVPLLAYKVVFNWQPYAISERPLLRALTVAGALLAPILMLAVVCMFEAGYQGERGAHWFFHIHSGAAGLALVPIYALGSLFSCYALTRPGLWSTSRINLVVLATLLAISMWYVFATLFLKLTKEVSGELTFLAIVPAIAAVNYGLLIADIRLHQQPLTRDTGVIAGWFSGLLITIAVKCYLAYEFYLTLPADRPPGYGDCFVVTAATHGHPNIVHSQYDPLLARTVTRQWRILRKFEDTLARQNPLVHRHLRRIYNQLGPPVAHLITRPWQADLVFFVLKPVEWFAKCYLTLYNVRSRYGNIK